MMNERIKELRRRATLVETYTSHDGSVHNGKSVDLEKFAELIVQRTLAIVEAHTEIFQSDEARAMVEHIKHSVKTDFGVEL
jgi:N-acetylmuramic acid 6-phosphate (MurNAc-6-P) etherase